MNKMENKMVLSSSENFLLHYLQSSSTWYLCTMYEYIYNTEQIPGDDITSYYLSFLLHILDHCPAN